MNHEHMMLLIPTDALLWRGLSSANLRQVIRYRVMTTTRITTSRTWKQFGPAVPRSESKALDYLSKVKGPIHMEYYPERVISELTIQLAPRPVPVAHTAD